MVKDKEISGREKADIKTLMRFVGIYCQKKHNGEKVPFSFNLLDLTEIEKAGDSSLQGLHETPSLWSDHENEMSP